MKGYFFMEDNNKKMRTAFIRVSAENHITVDNEKLGVKKGDIVKYTLDDILNTIDEWQTTKKFKYYLIEHNHIEGNKHWHIVLDFPPNSECEFNTLKNKIPYGQIDTCRTGVKNCVRYLVHADQPEKTQYPWDAIITNALNKLEDYKIPGKISINAETKKIINKIISGEIKEFEVDKIPSDIYIKKKKDIKHAFEYRQHLLVTDPNRNIEVYVLQGPPGVGKSTFCKVWAEKYNKSICFSSASRDPWQDYGGQSVFVYDDFDCDAIDIEDFKKALDPHTNTTMSRRYKNVLFTGDTIFICTNKPINKWFILDEDSSREAVFRRINYVIDFENNNKTEELTLMDSEKTEKVEGVSRYTVNKIVLSDKYKDIYGKFDRVVSRYREVELEPINNEIKEFDLRKYVDIHADKNKEQNFLKQIAEI